MVLVNIILEANAGLSVGSMRSRLSPSDQMQITAHQKDDFAIDSSSS